MICNKCVYPTLCLSFLNMLTRGDEQNAIEGLAFTQAHIYLLYQWYCHCHWPLGTLQDWMEIMTLARCHQLSALNIFPLDKPVPKKVVFTTVALVSPRLYLVQNTVRNYPVARNWCQNTLAKLSFGLKFTPYVKKLKIVQTRALL